MGVDAKPLHPPQTSDDMQQCNHQCIPSSISYTQRQIDGEITQGEIRNHLDRCLDYLEINSRPNNRGSELHLAKVNLGQWVGTLGQGSRLSTC